MTHIFEIIFAFISGFLLCAALYWKRFRELRQAFVAMSERIATVQESDQRNREMLSKVFARATEIRNILGGTVTLPTDAGKQDGQQSDAFSRLANLSGPSLNRRS